MRQFNQTILITAFLTIFSLTSCNRTNISGNKDKEIMEKEIELLKKENELLKKEQELNQKSEKQTPKQQPLSNDISDNLDFLKKYNGKYPSDVKLLDNQIIKIRLKKMLGSQYDFMKSIWDVEVPIEINNGLFYTWGMQAHSGGDPGAVLMADINNNILYVGIRKNGQEKFYSENGSNVPQRLQDWADE